MKNLLIIVLGLLMSLKAFAQHDNHGGTKHEEQSQSKKNDGMKFKENRITTYRVSTYFQDQLYAVFNESKQLTESFISEDPDQVIERAAKVKTMLTNVELDLLKTPEAQFDWMTYLKEMNTSLDDISKTLNSYAQKIPFSSFNKAFYKSIKAFGLSGHTVYYRHCPKALDNQGAYWISDTKEIRNPYLEKEMHKCGSIKDILD